MLIELVHVDLKRRLKAVDAMGVESYLERYPEFAGAAVLGLIAMEWELRRRQERARHDRNSCGFGRPGERASAGSWPTS